MYVIIGISGHVGSVTANTLLEKGLPVRGITRDPSKAAEWKKKGAELVVADLTDAAALEAAFIGTEGIFVMTPPLFDSNDPIADNNRMLSALVVAIEKTKPARVVYLSSVGAQHKERTGAIIKLHDMEKAFQRLSVPTIGIRAAWFMENFAAAIPLAKETGKLPSFLNPTDMPIPMVAVKDIGHLAEELLQEPITGHRILELEGPCRYSAADVAMVLSYQLGREVIAKAIPSDQYSAVYQSFGMTPAASALMAELNEGFNTGWITFEETGTEHRTGDILLEDTLRKLISE